MAQVALYRLPVAPAEGAVTQVGDRAQLGRYKTALVGVYSHSVEVATCSEEHTKPVTRPPFMSPQNRRHQSYLGPEVVHLGLEHGGDVVWRQALLQLHYRLVEAGHQLCQLLNVKVAKRRLSRAGELSTSEAATVRIAS